MIDLERIVVVGILIGPSFSHQMVHVDSGDDVDVIVTNVRMRSARHIIGLRMSFEFGKHGLWMLFFDRSDIFHIPKEQVLDMMRHVECLNDVIYPQSRIDVLVSVAADMEIPRHFLHSKVSLEFAPVSFLESLLRHLELSLLVGFFQQLEAFSIVNGLTIPIQSVLLDRPKVR